MDPYKVGENHELIEDKVKRTERGAWYTPRQLVKQLMRMLWDHIDVNEQIFVDPTCGGGAFLLAAADQLVANGVDSADALNRLHGLDIDQGAVEACREALRLWAKENDCYKGSIEAKLEQRIVKGDALKGFPKTWSPSRIYVGNPPFGSPLKSNSSEVADEFRKNRKEVFGPYADRSSLHFANCLENSDDTSTVFMVMPLSVVATKHLERFRGLVEIYNFNALWVADTFLFDASIKTCAVLVGGSASGDGGVRSVALYSGAEVRSEPVSQSSSWSELAADALGVPKVNSVGTSNFEGLVEATAGFRDEYYGLAEVCVENRSTTGSTVRLATTGMLGLLDCSWGEKEARFAKKRFSQPVVPKNVDDAKIQSWIERQLAPKVLVPTQAKVFKPFVDLDSAYVATTPILVVTGGDLLGFVAALFSPVVNLLAFRRNYGAGLSSTAIKLRATDLLKLPQPIEQQLWNQGREMVAELVQGTPNQSDLVDLASLMNRAYRGDKELLDWWVDRAF